MRGVVAKRFDLGAATGNSCCERNPSEQLTGGLAIATRKDQLRRRTRAVSSRARAPAHCGHVLRFVYGTLSHEITQAVSLRVLVLLQVDTRQLFTSEQLIADAIVTCSCICAFGHTNATRRERLAIGHIYSSNTGTNRNKLSTSR